MILLSIYSIFRLTDIIHSIGNWVKGEKMYLAEKIFLVITLPLHLLCLTVYFNFLIALWMA